MKKQQITVNQFLTQVAEESGLLGEWQRQAEARAEQAACQKTLETARSMKTEGTNIDFICRHTGLTAEQVRAL